MKVPKARKLKSGNWFIQLRLDGESISVTAPTEKECNRQAALIKAEHQAGKRKPTSDLTLKECMDKFIADRRPIRSPSTIRGYTIIRDKRFPDYINMQVKKIDWQEMVNTEFTRKGENGKTLSSKTVKNAWGFALSAVTHCTDIRPVVELPQIVSKQTPWLDHEEIIKFTTAIRSMDEEFERACLLALHSMRRSELYAFDKSKYKRGSLIVEGAIVMDENNQWVEKETNKTKKSRRVIPVMMTRLENLMKTAPAGVKLVTISPSTLEARIKRVCRQCGITEVTLHGLRHSFASLAHHVGMPEQECMELGGWDDPQTMRKIYQHVAKQDREKYTNAMKDFYTQAEKNANEIANAS